MADASVAFLEDGEGEGDSAKTEMMVASSTKLEGSMQAESHPGRSAAVTSRRITKPHLPAV